MRYTFTGAFAPHICGLIEKKQALGYDYHGSACILQTFDKFCREQFPNETCLTAELAMKWAEKSKTEQNLSRLNRVSVIRELAKHMNSVGEQAYLLPLQLTKKTGRHIPYIYSKEDLSKLFKEIDSLQPSLRAPTKHLVVRQLERLYPSLSGAVFHSDRGSQYTSLAFRSELSRCGMIQSLSGTGHCFDNARMESFFATLKKEKIYQIAAYKLPREQVKTIIFRYIFIYYNRVRVYTRNPLGLPPVKYQEWMRAQQAA